MLDYPVIRRIEPVTYHTRDTSGWAGTLMGLLLTTVTGTS